jgi:NO-binding membrane sensor protein with MHYT domain
MIGGGIIGGGIAVMHYTGMWAVQVPGQVTWDLPLVVVSVLLGVLLGIVRTRRRSSPPAAC